MGQRGDSGLLPEHQSGIIDLKAQAAGIVVATGLDELAASTSESGAQSKWDCISHDREGAGSSSERETSLLAKIWPASTSSSEPAAPSTSLPPPQCISSFSKSFWKNDVHFARQFLQGPHAEMIVACKVRGRISSRSLLLLRHQFVPDW